MVYTLCKQTIKREILKVGWNLVLVFMMMFRHWMTGSKGKGHYTENLA